MLIIINPGHSATDPGAIGPTGLHEADVTLAVAQMLVSRGSDGIMYVMQRQGPGKKGLGRLLLGLKQNPPAILVSLHCDAYAWEPGHCIHRATVYYWQGDPDVARRNASHRLAVLSREAARRPHGYAADALTRPAPYLRRRQDGTAYSFVPGILRGTARGAAVLIEMGFISDPHVENEMRRQEWLRTAATAIDRGIRRFVETNEIKEA